MTQESGHVIEINGGGAPWDAIREIVVPQIDRHTACGSPAEDRLGAIEMLSKVSILMDPESERLLGIWHRVFVDSNIEVRAAAFQELEDAQMPDAIKHWILGDAEEQEYLRNARPSWRTRLRWAGQAGLSFFLKDPEA
jgi:hypothetical protein